MRSPTRSGPDVVTAVPGVARLAPGHGLPMPQVGGAFAQPVRIENSDEPPPADMSRSPWRVAGDRRVFDVALAVRTAAIAVAQHDAPGPVTIAVLVTAAEPSRALSA